MDWTTIEMLKNDGKKAFSKKDYDKAFECYTEGIELINLGHNSTATVVQSNIAQAYLNKKDYSSAVEHANKSLELDSSFKKSMLRRAIANCKLKNYDEAMKDLRYLFEYEPTNSQVISLMRRCSDLPKMKQELRIAYVTYQFRHGLQKAHQDYATFGFSRFIYSCLPLTLFRHVFLSLENLEFVSQLLFGAYVIPEHSHVQLDLQCWFAVQSMRLKLLSVQRIILSDYMFKILFDLAPPKTFNLMFCKLPNKKMFGPWSRYSCVCYGEEKIALNSTINARDLQMIEQNSEMLTRMLYLQEVVKFKNNNFSNLNELVFGSTKSASMEFLKLWQKKNWPVKRLLFNDFRPKLESFKRFDGVISNQLTTLYIPFETDGIYFLKSVYHNLCNNLAVFKRVFPSLTEVNLTVNFDIDLEILQEFIEIEFRQLFWDACTVIDQKPEWCSNLRFLMCVTLGNWTVQKVRKVNLEKLKNAVESYCHKFVKKLHFTGPYISKFNWLPYTYPLCMLEIETDIAYFEVQFLINL